MGVMLCSRNGCPNIMCDTYISGIGYICRECQDEFKEYLKENGLAPKTEREIEMQLKNFMLSEKEEFEDGPEIKVDEFFRNHTR